MELDDSEDLDLDLGVLECVHVEQSFLVSEVSL